MNQFMPLAAMMFTASCLLAQQDMLPHKLQKEAAVYQKYKVKSVSKIGIGSVTGDTLNFQHRSIDENGRVVTEKIWNSYDDQHSVKTYTYGDDGLLSEMIEKDETGDYILSTEEYSYTGGKLSSARFISEDDEYTLYFIYDEQGRVDSSIVSSAEMRSRMWYYNSKGQVDSIVGFTIYNYEPPYVWTRVETQVFKYGKKGVVIQDSFCTTYSSCYIHDYKYKKGLVTLEIVSGYDAEIYRFTTSYANQLPVRKECDVNEEITYQEDEVQTFEYTYY